MKAPQRPQNSFGFLALSLAVIGSLALVSLLLFGTLLNDAPKSTILHDLQAESANQIDAILGADIIPSVQNVITKSPLQPFLKNNGSYDIHFIHIPKCGGTSMTSILRQVACTIDPSRNVDCCTNPGVLMCLLTPELCQTEPIYQNQPQLKTYFKNDINVIPLQIICNNI